MTGPSGGSPPLTLQINVAAVDVPYAKYNVPHLARAHRAAAREIILTIDRCKPQKTKQTQLLGNGDAKAGAVELAQKLHTEARVV